MFAGLHQDKLFVRLSETDREKVFVTYDGMRTFESMKGRIMEEYGVLPKSLYAHSATFNTLLNLSHKYVASLPPKTPKKKNQLSPELF